MVRCLGGTGGIGGCKDEDPSGYGGGDTFTGGFISVFFAVFILYLSYWISKSSFSWTSQILYA